MIEKQETFKAKFDEDLKINNIQLSKELEKVSPLACKKLYEFHNNLEDSNSEFKKIVWEKFNSCITKKINLFAVKKYPFLKNSINSEIFFWDKTSEYFLYELFYASLLSIIPESGYKLRDEEFNFTKISSNKFNLNILAQEKMISIEFENKNRKLYCNSMSSNGQLIVKDLEYLVKILFKGLGIYPQKDTHWDWNLIEKTK